MGVEYSGTACTSPSPAAGRGARAGGEGRPAAAPGGLGGRGGARGGRPAGDPQVGASNSQISNGDYLTLEETVLCVSCTPKGCPALDFFILTPLRSAVLYTKHKNNQIF